MSFAPLIAWWLIVLIAAAALAVAVHAYRGSPRLLLLRVAAIALAVFILAGPERTTDTASEPPEVVLVMDGSASMSLGMLQRDPFSRGASRLEKARAALDAFASAAGATAARPALRVTPMTLANGLRPGFALSATGTARHAALADLAARKPLPLAVIFAGDGADPDDDGTAAKTLAAAGVRVHTIAIGATRAPSNVRVRLETGGANAFPGQRLSIEAVVEATPDLIGRQSELRIVGSSGDSRDVPLLTRSVILAAQTRVSVPVTAPASAGAMVWRAEVATLENESTGNDNRAVAAMQVVDRQLRILVLEGKPWWDSAFAARAWRRDRLMQVETRHLVARRILSSTAQPALLDDAGLSDIDVVAIGDERDELISASAAAALTRFVDAGGGLLLLGPSQRSPWAQTLDPVIAAPGADDRVLTPSADGIMLGLGSERPLPALSTGRASGLRNGARLLAGDEHHPALAIRPWGRGSVGSIHISGLYTWKLAGGERAEMAERIWRQMVVSVARDEAPLAADRSRWRIGQRAHLRVRPATAPVTLLRPDGQPVVAAPDASGRFSIVLDHAGVWMLSSQNAQLPLVCDADVRELGDAQRRDDVLQRLAVGTGGSRSEESDAAALGTLMARRAQLSAAPPVHDSVVLSPWWAVALIALLASEWWLRRRRHGVV